MVRRALCKSSPSRPAIDLAVAMWTSLSPLGRWTLIGWGFRPSTLTLGAYAAVRGMP